MRRMVARYESLLPRVPAAEARAACCRTCARSSSTARPSRRALVSADRQHARRREGQAHALRAVRLLPRRRVCRGRRRPRDDCRPRAGTGAAGRSGRRRIGVRHRRHAARHRVRQRDRRAGRSRWRPAATPSRSCRRTIRGACWPNCRRWTSSSADATGAACSRRLSEPWPRRDVASRDEARHPAVSGALARDAAGAALVPRAATTPIRTGASCSAARQRALAIGAARRRRAVRAC